MLLLTDLLVQERRVSLEMDALTVGALFYRTMALPLSHMKRDRLTLSVPINR